MGRKYGTSGPLLFDNLSVLGTYSVKAENENTLVAMQGTVTVKSRDEYSHNVVYNNCVSMTSRALNMSGAFNIGIHPYLLHAQMYLRSIGIRPVLYSHFLLNY